MKHTWMPLYIGDYLKDTSRLTTLQHGAYLLLIMEYWTHGELLDDDPSLARIARLSEREWRNIKPAIAKLFKSDWTHKRIDVELQKADEKRAKRVEAGARGGEAKSIREASNASSNASSPPIANAGHLPEQCHSNAVANGVAKTYQSQSPSESSLRSDGARAPRSSPRKASRLSADWQPSEADRSYARSKGFTDRDIELEAEKIRNWSASSKNGAKLDWAAAWRNWILSAISRATGGGTVLHLPRRKAPDV